MNKKQLTKTSKFLSLVLRHQPERIGLKLDDAGWANVKELLKKAHLDIDSLEYIVENNNKKRFEFNEKKTKIRASQGHSIDVNLGYKAAAPPGILYHGTAAKNYDAIKSGGLKKMKRHHVHLSVDAETAKDVGARHGKPIVYKVFSGEMHEDGIPFYVSTNNVWLTEHVDPKYLMLIDGLYVVRVYDGFDYCWTDVTRPVPLDEAKKVWNERTKDGTQNTKYADIDYYKIFPAGTRMCFRS